MDRNTRRKIEAGASGGAAFLNKIMNQSFRRPYTVRDKSPDQLADWLSGALAASTSQAVTKHTKENSGFFGRVSSFLTSDVDTKIKAMERAASDPSFKTAVKKTFAAAGYQLENADVVASIIADGAQGYLQEGAKNGRSAVTAAISSLVTTNTPVEEMAQRFLKDDPVVLQTTSAAQRRHEPEAPEVMGKAIFAVNRAIECSRPNDKAIGRMDAEAGKQIIQDAAFMREVAKMFEEARAPVTDMKGLQRTLFKEAVKEFAPEIPGKQKYHHLSDFLDYSEPRFSEDNAPAQRMM